MKLKLTFLTIIFFGLGLYYLAQGGIYPMAIVNNTIISKRDFIKNYQAAAVYYRNALKTYAGKEIKGKSANEFMLELKRAVLDSLIENVLIYSELKNQVGDQLTALLEDKIPPFKESAALTVYGLNAADFKEIVLAPQARKEILENQLSLKNKNLDDWLKSARKSAKVYLFTFRVNWDGEGVVAK